MRENRPVGPYVWLCQTINLQLCCKFGPDLRSGPCICLWQMLQFRPTDRNLDFCSAKVLPERKLWPSDRSERAGRDERALRARASEASGSAGASEASPTARVAGPWRPGASAAARAELTKIKRAEIASTLRLLTSQPRVTSRIAARASVASGSRGRASRRRARARALAPELRAKRALPPEGQS